MAYPSDWPQRREAVEVRDERCVNCQRAPAGTEGVEYHTHHIVPLGWGGSNRLSNLVLLCEPCHDAAHGRRMAPRVTFESNGKMNDDAFDLFREYWAKHELARYDCFEQCWYVPFADMKYLVQNMPIAAPAVSPAL